MKVIVTGAASFLGLAVLRQLLNAGHQVGAVVRPASESRKLLPQHALLTIHNLDMNEIEKLPEQTGSADIFLHLAWDGIGSEGRQNIDIQIKNIEYSLCAVKAAKNLGCRRFLFSGSQAEYGIHQGIIKEDDFCRPVSEYGKAKLEFGNQAKPLCKSLKIEYIHTRIFSVYGPGDHPWSLISSCLSAWNAGGKIELSECTQYWNYLYIDDAARGLAALIEQGSAGTYNLAGADTRPLRSFVEEMHEVCAGQGSYEYGMRQPGAEGPASLMPSIEKIRKQTGWQPRVSFLEGIHETLSCMQRKPV